MQTIESFDGCHLAVYREGARDAPAVILSHYFGGNSTSWSAQAARLSRTHQVVRFDTRGQGESEATEGPYTVEMLGRDALAVMDALKIQVAAFVGLSQGAMAGMWLAIHHPRRVSRLVVANSTPFIPNKDMWNRYIQAARTPADVAGIMEPMILGWLSDGFKQRQPTKVHAAIAAAARITPAGFAGNCAVLRDVDLRSGLASIRCPTLVIAGAEDGPRGAASATMASTIPGATLMVIPDAAHLTALENPEVFNSAVTRFLGADPMAGMA